MTGGATKPSSKPNPMMDAFEPADRAAWLKLVEKALNGADFEQRLVTRTADGIRIDPLYTRADTTADAGEAGQAPFTRGTRAHVDGLGWHIHQLITDNDPKIANRHILEELEAGSNGIVLQTSAPGQPGVNIANAADMATVVTGAYLDFAPIQLKAGLNYAEMAKHFLDALAMVDAKPANTLGHLNLDPIGTWARWGSLAQSAAQSRTDAFAEAIEIAKAARASMPKLRTLNVDATIYHEAGASEGQELAAMAATLVAYLRLCEGAGIIPADAFSHIAFTLSADDDIFMTLAKIRAARRVIWRIADASGAGEAARALFLTVRTSERMLAQRDPWTNLLRATTACAAAVFAGANAITLHPFTWALGQPDAFARRIARNTQIVCQEESSLGRVVDPAGGSWYIENLTDDLAKAAWKKFQAIEAAGGIEAVLLAGTLQDDIASVRADRQSQIATGQQAITGVSAFPILGPDGVKFTPWPEATDIEAAPEIKPLTPHRLAEPFEALRAAADAQTATAGHPPRIFLANIGRIVDHTQRSTWVRNFMAAGGIEALSNDGFANAEDVATAFRESGASAACICSSDTLYETHAINTAKALKTAGANLVLIAGRPGKISSELTSAGVDQFVTAGADMLAVLSDLHKKL